MSTLKARWNALISGIDRWMHGNGGAARDDARVLRNADGKAVAYAARPNMAPRIFAGLLVLTAVVMIAFVAAASIVNALAKHGIGMTRAMIEQHAAAEYRTSRVRCQKMTGAAREACIAEAHAAEERARAVGMLAKKDYVTALRSVTDAAIDAGDRDPIVVEPACNVVAHGQGSLCEIQVRPNAVGRPAGTNLIPAAAMAAQPFAGAQAAAGAIRAARPRADLSPVLYGSMQQVPATIAPSPMQQGHAQPAEERIFELAWSSRQ